MRYPVHRTKVQVPRLSLGTEFEEMECPLIFGSIFAQKTKIVDNVPILFSPKSIQTQDFRFLT